MDKYDWIIQLDDKTGIHKNTDVDEGGLHGPMMEFTDSLLDMTNN